MTKHTPGPWLAEGFGVWSQVNGDNRRVACSEYDRGEGCYKVKTEQEAIHNARLCAAAPDLLEACQDAMEFFANGTPIHVGSVVHHAIAEAIAKATH